MKVEMTARTTMMTATERQLRSELVRTIHLPCSSFVAGKKRFTMRLLSLVGWCYIACSSF